MNELKKGDFSGIYTRETGKPLFYTGIFDRMTDEDGRPCVFLATDPSNKNTFYRWTQSDLLKRGYYISKTGKNTIPRTAARLHIIFTHSGSLDGVRAVVEKDIYNRWIATTETGEQYMLFSDHIRIAAYCIILKTETAEEIENSGMHPYQIMYIRKSLEAVQAEPLPEESTNAQEGPTADESNTDKETTTGADKATEEATQRPQEATTSAGTNADTETPTQGETAPQEATSEPETAQNQDNTSSTPEATQNGPTTAGTVPGKQDNTGSDTTPPRAQEANQDPGHAAGDHSGQAADHITGPGTAAGDYTGPTTGNTSGAAAGAITDRTTTTPPTAGHACENAPGRAERTTADKVHTSHSKSPPRGKTQGRHTTTGSRGHPGKSYFFRPDAKNESDHREILWYPTFERLVSANIVKKFSGSYRAIPPGVSKINTFPGAKNFSKNFFLRKEGK